MIKFIWKLFKLIFTLFIAFIIFTYFFATKTNMSFEDAFAYLKNVGFEVLDIDNSTNISLDEHTNTDNIPGITLTNSNHFHFYYEQLDDTSKIIYNSFESNIDNLKKGNHVIDFSTKFNDLLNTSTGRYRLNKAFQSSLDAFFYDHPELFYIDLSKISLNTQCMSIGPIKTYTVKISPKNNNYFHDGFNSEQEVKSAIKQLESIRNSIVNKVSEYSTYNKIKYVHDMLVNSIEYDTTLSRKNIYNIYGALVEKTVVCEGYAKAFKYIMDGLDLETILVIGKSTSPSSTKPEDHMWNYIKLNDSWYGVDVTWDDPIINGGAIKNNLRHTYFLKGRNTFSLSHEPSGKISNSGMLFDLPSLSTQNYK